MNQKLPQKSIRKPIWQLAEWPNFHARNPAVREALLSARKKQGEVIGQANAIGLKGAQELIQDRYVHEVLATAAIEGEKLNLDSVRSSVLRKIGLPLEGDTALPNQKVDGLVDILQDALGGYEDLLTKQRLCLWHRALFPLEPGGRSRIKVGGFREHEDPMQIVSGRPGKEIIHFIAPPSTRVGHEVKIFLHWFNETKPSNQAKQTIKKDSNYLDGLERAAIAHLWFETIHPFEDGNGRLGRAIVEMAMAQDAQSEKKLYSISEQMMAKRSNYYDALNAAQHGDLEISDWIIWFAKACEEACDVSCSLMVNALQKSSFWNLFSHVSLNERKKKVIQRLLDDGDGGFLGGLSAEKYIKLTGASKATATRDLSDLLGAGMLFSNGQGKAMRYYINVTGWGHGIR